MDGRVNLQQYFSALKTLFNMIVHPLGPAIRRGGTVYAGEVKNSASHDRLLNFEFSSEQAYAIEVGHHYMRFFTDGGAVATPSGSDPYEIETTINQASLPYLYWAQSADTMYIVSQQGDMPPLELVRNDHDDWSISEISFTSDPFNGATGFPKVCGFFEQRSIWANTPAHPQRIWLSKTGIYHDLTLGTEDDDAIDITIAADRINPLVWLAPMNVLLFGTAGGEWRISSDSYTNPITPTNIIARRIGVGGCEAIMPEVVGLAVLYVQRHSRRVRELAYTLEYDSYVSKDLSKLAEHLTNTEINGSSIAEIAYASEPNSILWARLYDGSLIGCTYDRYQGVTAWHRHETDGVIENIRVIPGSGRDELWMVVRRTINGTTKRYIEVMKEPDFDELENAWYLDCALQYSGNAATIITGLDHLNGSSVAILADGAVVADQTVNAGSIVLDNAASVVIAGLPFTSAMQTMRLEAGGDLGTSQTKLKKIHAVGVRLYRSAGFEIGMTDDGYDEVPMRTTGMAMDAPPDLFTGDREIMAVPSNWDRNGYVYIRQALPLPLSVTAIVAKIRTEDI